jgi:phosphoesterase RecJ-like protein
MIRKLLDAHDVDCFRDMIVNSDHIVVTCHVRPDGDAIGSSLGLFHLFTALGKKVKVVTPDMAPRALSFMPGFKEVVPYTKYQDYAERLIAEADLIICCDFNKLSRQDALGAVVEKSECKRVLIDHHQFPDNFTDLMFSFPKMSSTCELAFRIICAMGLFEEMNQASATCLATGIITDTRNLSVNCDDPELYIIMYELLSKGVDKKRIIREALELSSMDSFKLKSFALSDRLQLIPEHKTAVIALSKEDLQRFNYEKGDTEGLVNQPLTIQGIVASYFLREDSDCIKVSARSVNDFPVSMVCEDLFNGGGHVQAAGGEYVAGSLEDCKQLLLDSLKNYDRYFKKNRTNE